MQRSLDSTTLEGCGGDGVFLDFAPKRVLGLRRAAIFEQGTAVYSLGMDIKLNGGCSATPRHGRHLWLPFSVIGSLNGVHMFGQNLEMQLSSARTENTTVVWKSFHDSITLIVLSSEVGISELRLERLLQMVFGAMVLLVGLEELTNIRNVERLKKDLRASYCLIDSFLGDSELIGDLTQCVDCVIPPEGSLLQVPHRLLTLTLLPSLELCLLCGPSPPLSQLYPQLLERWWQPLLDPLRACLPLGPRALPSGFRLHTDILGLLLLHLELKRCLFTVEPLGDKAEPSPEQRRRLLRNFYTLVTSTHFPPDEETEAQLMSGRAIFEHGIWLPYPHSPAFCTTAESTGFADRLRSQGHQRRQKMRSTRPSCPEPATWCWGLRNQAQECVWWPCSWGFGGCCCCYLPRVPPMG
ncbi:protein fuzzy homolog isoform X11 [Pongo abelii]|uniref:protein fuzzy homolog isoform X11 n=1 Tax=Pongo abelii TaxID=9601 RepID=UPI00300562F6